ncbi:hypothetical protein J4216_05300 [Candidatus Woesearchaeota archaeon]|nr:hypothetical protein [Candidatus Woesearchaeota archaeon]
MGTKPEKFAVGAVIYKEPNILIVTPGKDQLNEGILTLPVDYARIADGSLITTYPRTEDWHRSTRSFLNRGLGLSDLEVTMKLGEPTIELEDHELTMAVYLIKLTSKREVKPDGKLFTAAEFRDPREVFANTSRDTKDLAVRIYLEQVGRDPEFYKV